MNNKDTQIILETLMGEKTQQNFLNIDRPKTEQKILLYSFTRKSSAPLNQEIPRDRPKTLLDVNT